MVWSTPDPVDQPPPHHPLQRQQLTFTLATNQAVHPGKAQPACPLPPSIVKMPTFGRVVIVFVFQYFDRRLWVAENNSTLTLILKYCSRYAPLSACVSFPVCVPCLCQVRRGLNSG